jgi:hypothetical protein
MLSCAVRGAPHPVALVGSHPLPTVPVSGQPRDVELLSRTVAACPHVLQVMMMPHVCTSCKHLGKTRVYHGNMQILLHT